MHTSLTLQRPNFLDGIFSSAVRRSALLYVIMFSSRFVCELNSSKSCEWTFMKFGELVERGPEKSRLHFERDAKRILDISSVVNVAALRLLGFIRRTASLWTRPRLYWYNGQHSLLHARTCSSPVTTLCRFECGAAEMCAVMPSGCAVPFWYNAWQFVGKNPFIPPLGGAVV